MLLRQILGNDAVGEPHQIIISMSALSAEEMVSLATRDQQSTNPVTKATEVRLISRLSIRCSDLDLVSFEVE